MLELHVICLPASAIGGQVWRVSRLDNIYHLSGVICTPSTGNSSGAGESMRCGDVRRIKSRNINTASPTATRLIPIYRINIFIIVEKVTLLRSRFDVYGLPDEIERSSLDLCEDPADILPDNPEYKYLHPCKESDRDKYCSPPSHPVLMRHEAE